ncbi:MAG TPA: hypothetical protein IAB02_00470 [Candidatus Pullichristensenella excrementigallinarum]|uniref:Uncharacterized protein n=1 Tax=Candidatus Pullichristensenella excrementigallinarum TaxID=2840907 RepID=A0A9D1LB47_9FIRM|nr:hypothetical protein [Candidatus Pullichristensenella excrementigallinarum]
MKEERENRPLAEEETQQVGGGLGEAFGGLPMGTLIAGPLHEAYKAQQELAQASMDFLREVGLHSEGGDPSANGKE